MLSIRNLVKGQAGFTLLEMGTVSVIIAALAAIVGIAVTGAASDSRTSTKVADMKNVDTAVARYDNDNGASPISESAEPVERVVGQGVSDVIKLVIDTTQTDFTTGTVPSGSGVVTCDTTSTTSIAAAVDDCLGSIDFSVLVPSYLSAGPTHASDDAKESGTTTIEFDDDAGTSDASYVNCTQSGETCELYFADDGGLVASSGVHTLPSGVIKVWNVDKNDGVVIIKGNADYGK